MSALSVIARLRQGYGGRNVRAPWNAMRVTPVAAEIIHNAAVGPVPQKRVSFILSSAEVQ